MALRAMGDLGVPTIAAVARNSWRSELGRRREARVRGGAATMRTVGRLLDVEPIESGVHCRFANATLEVVFVADDAVRVTWGPDPVVPPWGLAPAGPGRSGAGRSGPVAELHLEHPGSLGCRLIGGGLSVRVRPDGGIEYANAAGYVVRRELGPLRRGDARISQSRLRSGEQLRGLGEQAGPVELGGRSHRLWNRDPGGSWGPASGSLYCVVPVLVGLHPEGDVLVFWENPHDGTVHIPAPRATAAGAEPSTEVSFAGGPLRSYVMAGSLPQLLERYTELTGRPPLPPRWALGYHHSRWGYRTGAAVHTVVEGFVSEGVPLSAVHLDIDHMDHYRVFTVDAARFPDLAGLSVELAAAGTRLVTIVDPGVTVDDAGELLRADGAEGRFLRRPDGDLAMGVAWPGPVVFPDFTDPGTRRWWGAQYQRLVDAGAAGVWHDMNEPTSMALWGDRTLPNDTLTASEGQGGDLHQAHNVYGLLMDEAGRDGLLRARPDRRPWVLSRSGWAGVQRSAWNWTGDVESSWVGLRQQIPTFINLGLSGLAYCGSDIGGFTGNPSPELYLRWLELAVLTPFCRTHSVTGMPGREPWRFPSPHREAIGRLIRLRYRLLPYLYTLAWEASRTGWPLLRPLCWPSGWPGSAGDDDGMDRALTEVDDAFLLGSSLLVAPAMSPGLDRRPLRLPPGEWYRWRLVPATGESGVAVPAGLPEPVPIPGDQTVTADTPLGQPVVLVRAGTVLPLDDGWVGEPPPPLSLAHQPVRLALYCFPDDDGAAAGVHYDDAGDGPADGRGERRVDRFDLSMVGGQRRLRWDREGGYPPPRSLRVVLPGPAGWTTLDRPPFEQLVVDTAAR